MRQRLISEDEYLNVLADRFNQKSISSERTLSAILYQIVIQAFPPGATMPPATPLWIAACLTASATFLTPPG